MTAKYYSQSLTVGLPSHGIQDEVVASSQEKRCTAADEKAALDLAHELREVSPPVLAYVPDRWPDGRAKEVRGWKVEYYAETCCIAGTRASRNSHPVCRKPRGVLVDRLTLKQLFYWESKPLVALGTNLSLDGYTTSI